MKKRFDIVIVGAGMVGLTIACLLAASRASGKIALRVIDAGSRAQFNADEDVSLRVSAISIGSMNTFADIRVWDAVRAQRACAYRDMRVWDAGGHADGPETLRFDAADFAVPELGFIVENDLIQHCLQDRLESLGIAVEFGTRIAAVKREARRFAVETGGETLHPDLLIAADGGASFVRTSVGIPVSAWRYRQDAFVTHLRPERSHRNTAWQRFLPTGPVALLPLCDGRVSTVWSTTPAQAEAAAAAGDEELGDMLSEATDHVLGHLRPAGPHGAFPLRAQHASRYVMPGLALVGDAAHSVHPLAGQGANLGIADARVLAQVVSTAMGAGEHPGDMPVLRRYERARKGANRTMLYFVDSLNRLFAIDASPVARLRGIGMRLFNSSGPIRQRAVQVALGIT